MVWIVTYWDFDQEPVVTPFNNRENTEKCWAYFKEIHDGCCLDECEVFSNFLTPNENGLSKQDILLETQKTGLLENDIDGEQLCM